MIVIRQAGVADIPRIRELARHESIALGFFSQVMIEQQVSLNSILLAFQEETCVGFADFHHRRNRSTTLYHITVSRTARRQGIGALLVEAVCDRARAAGNSEVRLKAIATLPANHFYEQQELQWL